MQELLSIRSIDGDVFVFQQNNAPAHCAGDTVDLLRRRETTQFISSDMWQPTVDHDLNPVDYRIWGIMQERVYWVPIRDMDKLRQRRVEIRAEFQQSVVNIRCDWSMAKKTGSVRPRRRCSLWTLAVTLLAWQLTGSFQSQPIPHNTNLLLSELPAFGGKTIYLQSDEQVLHFTR